MRGTPSTVGEERIQRKERARCGKHILWCCLDMGSCGRAYGSAAESCLTCGQLRAGWSPDLYLSGQLPAHSLVPTLWFHWIFRLLAGRKHLEILDKQPLYMTQTILLYHWHKSQPILCTSCVHVPFHMFRLVWCIPLLHCEFYRCSKGEQFSPGRLEIINYKNFNIIPELLYKIHLQILGSLRSLIWRKTSPFTFKWEPFSTTMINE